VSSGLDKEEVYDMDKIGAQMEADMTNQAPATLEPNADPAAVPDAGSASEPATPAANDDPMKAMLESMDKPKN